MMPSNYIDITDSVKKEHQINFKDYYTIVKLKRPGEDCYCLLYKKDQCDMCTDSVELVIEYMKAVGGLCENML